MSLFKSLASLFCMRHLFRLESKKEKMNHTAAPCTDRVIACHRVKRAVDIQTGEMVAMKVIRKRDMYDAGSGKRFTRLQAEVSSRHKILLRLSLRICRCQLHGEEIVGILLLLLLSHN